MTTLNVRKLITYELSNAELGTRNSEFETAPSPEFDMAPHSEFRIPNSVTGAKRRLSFKGHL